MKKSILQVELMYKPLARHSKAKNRTDSSRLNYRDNSLITIDTRLLVWGFVGMGISWTGWMTRELQEWCWWMCGMDRDLWCYHIGGAYYPERLARLYILSMPRFFVSAWKMISYFIDKATLDKIVIVTNEEERRRFITEVGKEALPEEFGGEAKLVALQDVEVPQVIKC
nr:hypothetical protein [Tanacetum cinerariifolium]